jgi:ABC-type microcin C transport system permease subunit YejB
LVILVDEFGKQLEYIAKNDAGKTGAGSRSARRPVGAFARAFGGAIVIERIFSLPGLGAMTVDAITQRDLPLLQGVIPLAVVVAITVTLLSDIINFKINPRLQFDGK